MPSRVSFTKNPGAERALINAVAAAGYADVVSNIQQPSMEQVPVKTGALRRSAMTDKPQIDGTQITIRVSYNTDYAIHVHEDLGAYHPHGNAKFLERPALAAANGMADRIAAKIGSIL